MFVFYSVYSLERNLDSINKKKKVGKLAETTLRIHTKKIKIKLYECFKFNSFFYAVGNPFTIPEKTFSPGFQIWQNYLHLNF